MNAQTSKVKILLTLDDYDRALVKVTQQRDELLAAARRAEAQSHWNNDVYGYVVSKEAMEMLCTTIFK